jgi:hypothetical protein
MRHLPEEILTFWTGASPAGIRAVDRRSLARLRGLIPGVILMTRRSRNIESITELNSASQSGGDMLTGSAANSFSLLNGKYDLFQVRKF